MGFRLKFIYKGGHRKIVKLKINTKFILFLPLLKRYFEHINY